MFLVFIKFLCQTDAVMCVVCNVFSRAIQQNTLLLQEECESLRQKLNRAEERSVTLSTLEVECEVSCSHRASIS